MRLIDADALIDDMCEDCGAIVNGACDKDVCASVLWVKNAPTIEAEPVRHGRWVIEGEEYRSMTVRCTSCDYVRHVYGWGLPALKRDLKVNCLCCNKCGAKMDGGDENGEC